MSFTMAARDRLQDTAVTILRNTAHGMRLARAIALVWLPFGLLSVASHAGPPPAAPAVAVANVAELRGTIEQAMAELGRMASTAEGDADVARAACVVDKQERGREVMELATGEVLVAQDPSSTEQQRNFAAEKLQALGDRMRRLIEEASACGGDKSPEDKDDKTRTEVDERPTVPYADPTVSGAGPSVPPSVDDSRPPSVESPTN